MFPLQDINPRRRTPILTYTLIVLNVLVFLWEMSLGQNGLERAFFDLAAVPANLTNNPFSLEAFLDIMRSMFLHGGWDHILGNMLYLWLFGDNLEDRLGGILYLVLYFASGFVATIAQTVIDPTSTIPMIGASGAIAGVLGGYLLMFPGVRVRGIVPIGRISQLAEMPAWTVLGLWFVLQLVQGFGSLGASAEYGGGVAFFAHIGGFIAGLVLTWIFMRMVPQPPASDRRQMLYQRSTRGI
ncbi:MAG TPA: rhomboid family intramembrane serine protease [Phototrophicaceae bacterium]|nr:rhomboid family intramembrane serine protease [Phototrophicaceae bacterium]